jgi:hypothetical protein
MIRSRIVKYFKTVLNKLENSMDYYAEQSGTIKDLTMQTRAMA